MNDNENYVGESNEQLFCSEARWDLSQVRIVWVPLCITAICRENEGLHIDRWHFHSFLPLPVLVMSSLEPQTSGWASRETRRGWGVDWLHHSSCLCRRLWRCHCWSYQEPSICRTCGWVLAPPDPSKEEAPSGLSHHEPPRRTRCRLCLYHEVSLRSRPCCPGSCSRRSRSLPTVPSPHSDPRRQNISRRTGRSWSWRPPGSGPGSACAGPRASSPGCCSPPSYSSSSSLHWLPCSPR